MVWCPCVWLSLSGGTSKPTILVWWLSTHSFHLIFCIFWANRTITLLVHITELSKLLLNPKSSRTISVCYHALGMIVWWLIFWFVFKNCFKSVQLVTFFSKQLQNLSVVPLPHRPVQIFHDPTAVVSQNLQWTISESDIMKTVAYCLIKFILSSQTWK